MAVVSTVAAGALRALGAIGDRMPRSPAISERPMVGIVAVMLGAFIVTLGGRVTSFGLVDIRGAVHAGVDEGAWITTASTVGQMIVCAPTVWMGVVYGPRRILLVSTAVLAVSSLLLPLSDSLYGVLVLQFVGGIAMGTFFPLTISFILRNLPDRLVIYGIAVYAMNSELSQNVSASLEGWYLENWSWHWIFWQNAILAIPMWLCVYFGMPRRPIEHHLIRGVDKSGMIYFSLGFSLIYAALDHGNRLDWLNDGMIVGLLLGGGLLLLSFVIRELTSAEPWLDLRFIMTGGIALPAVMLTFLRLAMLATSFLIPQFLTNIQGFRALQVGDALLLIAVPQILIGPLIATILRFIDPRFTMATGFAFIGFACLWVGSTLTPDWASPDFIPSQSLQALGQSFAMTSLIAYNTRLIRPEDALTFGTLMQTTRMMGGEVGIAFMETFVRVREQIHSNLLNLHVVSGLNSTVARLEEYAGMLAGRMPGDQATAEGATALLASTVQKQAYVLAYIDGFMAIGIATILCLGLMLFLRTPIQPPPG